MYIVCVHMVLPIGIIVVAVHVHMWYSQECTYLLGRLQGELTSHRGGRAPEQQDGGSVRITAYDTQVTRHAQACTSFVVTTMYGYWYVRHIQCACILNHTHV